MRASLPSSPKQSIVGKRFAAGTLAAGRMSTTRGRHLAIDPWLELFERDWMSKDFLDVPSPGAGFGELAVTQAQ